MIHILFALTNISQGPYGYVITMFQVDVRFSTVMFLERTVQIISLRPPPGDPLLPYIPADSEYCTRLASCTSETST